MISRLPKRIVASANAPYEAQEGRWYSSVRLVCTFLQKNPSKFIKWSQCCGTLIICCGSCSDLVKVLVPVPDPDNIKAKFSKNKKKLQRILHFQCPKKLTSQKVGLILDFFTSLLHFMLDPNPLVSRSGTGNVMHYRSGSAKLKSYGRFRFRFHNTEWSVKM